MTINRPQDSERRYFKLGLTDQEHARLKELAQDRGRSMSELLRWYISQDYECRLVHITKAVTNLANALMEGFGSGVALIAAEAERTILARDRWKA